MSKYGHKNLDWFEALVNKMGGVERAEAFLRGDLVLKEIGQLEFLGIVTIPATSGTFIAREKFVVNTSEETKVKISYIGDNFIQWFLSGFGKIEGPSGEQTLRYAELRQFSVNGPIIVELGGVEKSETTLAEMFSLMEKQKNGENGVLLNDSYANVFYIKDYTGALRAVCVRWNDDGWDVTANSVENPYRWSDGDQVFSRNSVLEPSEPVLAAS